MNQHVHQDSPGQKQRSPWVVVLGMLTVIVLFFALREHWGHVAGMWVYLLLLACPLMHLFGHGGHGNHGNAGESNEKTS